MIPRRPRRARRALPLALLALALGAPAQQLAKAEMFYAHRLYEDAKRTAIEALFADGAPATQLRGKMLLARIAADERRIGDAMELWQDIATNHRDTEAGKAAAAVVRQWSNFAVDAYPPLPADPRAAAWFAAAAFWGGEPEPLPDFGRWRRGAEDAAEHWLRKVVTDVGPGPAARRALYSIARVHVGRLTYFEGPSGSGALAHVNGLLRTDAARFEHHIARAERAVRELAAMAPDAPEVPQLQLLLAYAFHLAGEAERSHRWLLEAAGGAEVETLWTRLAKQRLELKTER